ncbi:hypothetical protein Gpo141_00014439, partial [Globisporangium polare]
PARRTLLAVAAFVTAATVVALQLTSFKTHYDTHLEKHRILRSLQELPSLHLQLSIKRSTMFVNGASQVDVFANPVVAADGGIAYDGISTIVEKDVTHKYLLVDGAAYHVTESLAQSSNGTTGASSTATCLPSSDLPPLNNILSAINAASPVSSDLVTSSAAASCPTGKLFTVSFAGDDFLLCSALASGESGFKVFGADLDVEFKYLSSAVAIDAPTLSSEVLAPCGKVPSSTVVTASSLDLLKGAAKDFTSRRSLKAEGSEAVMAAMASSTCACKGKKRACIFIPGLGRDTENGLVDSLSYFGTIQDNAPCCSSVKFADVNTNAAGWTDATLQQKICDYALAVSNTSSAATKTIEDTIVVAHSLGNLVLSGAIANGRCKLAASSTWVAVSAPMIGSMASNYLQDACAGKLNSLVNSVAQLIGKCPANPAIQALAYQGDVYSSASLDAQYTAAQAVYKKSVSAALCSNGYNGLLSTSQVVFALAGSVIPHKSDENDGIVEYQSCAKGLSTAQFGTSYTSPFYLTKLNHEDTTFRHGDALFNNAQKPVKW